MNLRNLLYKIKFLKSSKKYVLMYQNITKTVQKHIKTLTNS